MKIKKKEKGMTLIELIISLSMLLILLFGIFNMLNNCLQNWTTINPQLTARQSSREILYGKTGEEWGGLVGEIKACNIGIMPSTPLELGNIIPTSFTTLNLQTYYATGTLVGTVAICYEWKGVGTTTPYPLGESVSQIGTLTKTVWKQNIVTTTWELIPTKTLTLAGNIRMGSVTYGTLTAYPLFKYYMGLGIEKYDDPDTPGVNELLEAIQGDGIRQIGISMVFDIDTDKDGKFGEDPLGNGNDDNDRKVDEDKPADFRIKTRVAGMNLDW